MSEYINIMKNNINQKNTDNNKKAIPYELAQFLNLYKNFTEKMDKSDFANSPRRYIVELNIVKEIKEMALSNNITSEAERMAEKEQDINAKLKDEFGIVIKD